jgi:hypothetical protein
MGPGVRTNVKIPDFAGCNTCTVFSTWNAPYQAGFCFRCVKRTLPGYYLIASVAKQSPRGMFEVPCLIHGIAMRPPRLAMT